MADIDQLLREAPLSFIGTITHVGAATMTGVPIDEQTAVVQVEQVLHAPAALSHLEGQRLTLQVSPDAEAPEVGQTAAFFVQGVAFGESLAVSEIGRASLEELEPQLTGAAEAGEQGVFASALRQIAADRLREHSQSADAVVVGRVIKLENAVGPARTEHDPDWWKATLEVDHVESGTVEPGELEVLYPNSLDVRWAAVPKPIPSEQAVWILHATEGNLREAAPFEILHPDDYQPVQSLDQIRQSGS